MINALGLRGRPSDGADVDTLHRNEVQDLRGLLAVEFIMSCAGRRTNMNEKLGSVIGVLRGH